MCRYFRGAQTEDENVLEAPSRDFTNTNLPVDVVMNVTFDNSKQVDVSDSLCLLKTCFEQLSQFSGVTSNDSGDIIVTFPEQQQNEKPPFLRRKQIEMVALTLKKIIEKQGGGNVDISIKHEGKMFYDACITQNTPFDAVRFVNSISAEFSKLHGKTMCITIGKEPLDIILKKGDIVGDVLGTGTIKYARDHTEDLKILFQEENNWQIVQCYADIKINENKALPFQVVVYECLPYIMEKNGYLVEAGRVLDKTKLNSFSETIEILIFAIFDPKNEQATALSNGTSIKFLGVYQLDKGKSQKENFFSFRLLKDKWNTRIRSSHNR